MRYQFQHVHLICSDLKTMSDFFTENFDAEFLGETKFGQADGVKLSLAGTLIFLRLKAANEDIDEKHTAKTFGYDHIGIETDDVDESYRQLLAKGCLFSGEPNKTKNGKVVFMKGPDNITIELLTPPDK